MKIVNNTKTVDPLYVDMHVTFQSLYQSDVARVFDALGRLVYVYIKDLEFTVPKDGVENWV